MMLNPLKDIVSSFSIFGSPSKRGAHEFAMLEMPVSRSSFPALRLTICFLNVLIPISSLFHYGLDNSQFPINSLLDLQKLFLILFYFQWYSVD